ncbi:hypothetical protein M9Y10_042292 [Tritrichomonas musculus]|uniref:Surface antigen BspA-like n=1 Tax=Tritrichomonas musculus TaxID=1915356 RepID=A0ABR2GP14_9EUKA
MHYILVFAIIFFGLVINQRDNQHPLKIICNYGEKFDLLHPFQISSLSTINNMQNQNVLILSMNAKEFPIPKNFPRLIDVKPEIYKHLMTNGKYDIKSIVSTDTLDSFINHWVNSELPYICADNLSEYETLSEEFDKMKNIIQIFRKKLPDHDISSLLQFKNQLLQEKKQKIKEFDELTAEYHQIIRLNLQNPSTRLPPILDNAKLRINYAKRNNLFSLFTKKTVNDGYLRFYLKYEDKTANVTYNNDCQTSDDIFIPKSVTYENEEFIVTKIMIGFFKSMNKPKTINFSEDSLIQVIDRFAFFDLKIQSLKIPSSVTHIGEGAFYNCDIKSVEFMENSKLVSIGKDAFCMATIESLTIPSSVVSFEERWCDKTFKLTKIKIIENETKNICYYDDKFIIGKSDQKSDNYDLLLFARRDIETANIPSFIKRISPYAFNYCTQLQTVEFSENSSLQVIGCYAFMFTSITRITIPSSVVMIDTGAFDYCKQLESVGFLENSNLKIICHNAFANSGVKSIAIPSSIVSLKSGWCKETMKLANIRIIQNETKNICYYDDKFIIGKSDQKSDNYDLLLFARRDIETANIPSFIKRISPYAFNYCTQLQTVEFSENSSLQIIDDNAFSMSSLQKVDIPSNVAEIGQYSFNDCDSIEKVEFSIHSKLRTIHDFAFMDSSLKIITLPSSVCDFKKSWCKGASNLNNIKIIQNRSKNICYYDNKFIIGKSDLKRDNFDVLYFARRDIRFAIIPSFVKKIASFAFTECDRLLSVDFEPNSQLELIDNGSFEDCNLERIYIPSSVSRIAKAAFNCKLKIIDFEDDSKLKEFEPYVFDMTNLKSIVIPKNVSKIDENAFARSYDLLIIEISENSELSDISCLDSQLIMIPISMKNTLQF